MKTALALSALLLATPAMADSMFDAAMLGLNAKACKAAVSDEQLGLAIVEAAVDRDMTVNQATFFAAGMAEAYWQVLEHRGTVGEFCAAGKTEGTRP